MLPYLQMANWKALKNIPQVCPTSSSSWTFHVIAHCPQIPVVLHLLFPPSFTVPSWFCLPKEAICISGIQLSSCMIVGILYLLKKRLEVSTLSKYMNLLWYAHTYPSSHLSSLPYSLTPLYISYQLFFLFYSHSFCLFLCMRRNISWFLSVFWSILLNMIWLSQSICHKSYDFKILYFLRDK